MTLHPRQSGKRRNRLLGKRRRRHSAADISLEAVDLPLERRLLLSAGVADSPDATGRLNAVPATTASVATIGLPGRVAFSATLVDGSKVLSGTLLMTANAGPHVSIVFVLENPQQPAPNPPASNPPASNPPASSPPASSPPASSPDVADSPEVLVIQLNVSPGSLLDSGGNVRFISAGGQRIVIQLSDGQRQLLPAYFDNAVPPNRPSGNPAPEVPLPPVSPPIVELIPGLRTEIRLLSDPGSALPRFLRAQTARSLADVNSDNEVRSLDEYFSTAEAGSWLQETDVETSAEAFSEPHTDVFLKDIGSSSSRSPGARAHETRDVVQRREPAFTIVTGGRYDLRSEFDAAGGTAMPGTAASGVHLRGLVDVLMRFSTQDLLCDFSRDEFSDWLRRQFDLELTSAEHTQSADDQSHDNLPGEPVAYADSSPAETGRQDVQRQHPALSRIDTGGGVEHFVLLLSDQPPEPPVIVGIWQQLKFDCNPRGPPTSETLSGTATTRLDAKADQLQRLRFSIAPRGPSVTSTF